VSDGCSHIYLYGSIDNDVYMKILEGFKMPEAYNSNSQKVYSIKIKVLIWVKAIRMYVV